MVGREGARECGGLCGCGLGMDMVLEIAGGRARCLFMATFVGGFYWGLVWSS